MKRKVNISDIHKLITKDDSFVFSDDDRKAILEDSNYESINSVWEDSLLYTPDESFSPKAGFDSFKNRFDISNDSRSTHLIKNAGIDVKQKPRKIFYLRKMAVAASIILIAAVVSVLFFLNTATKYNTNDNVQNIAMIDQSSIVLDKQSTLIEKPGYGTDHRTVVLNGKANFDIKKNKDLPFKILMGSSSVEVLGTQFDLSNMNGIIELALIEGKVRFSTDGGESYEIIAGERLTYVEKTLKINTSKIDDYSVFSWSNNGLRYTNASVSHVLTSLSQYFDYDLKWSGHSAELCTKITMTNIVDPKIDELVEIIESIVDIDLGVDHSSKTIEVININC